MSLVIMSNEDKGQSGHLRMWTPHFVGCLRDHIYEHQVAC